MPEFVNDFYSGKEQAFLYDPSGKCMFGYFKEKGTEIYDNMRPECSVYERPARDNRLFQYKDNLQYELVAGINLDFNTGVFKPTYYGYDTPDEAIKVKGQKIQIAEKKIKNAARNKHAQMEKVLVQKYGRKAFDAMEDFRPYIGMPEGIVREYRVVMKDVNFIAYGFVRVESGYKVYLPTRLFAMTASYINARFPRAIYTKNGKVAAIKW